MADFMIEADASKFNAALKEVKKRVALLTPPISRCIICGKIKDEYGNHIRHFWYHKFTAKIVLFNLHCNCCSWPNYPGARATQNALKRWTK